MADQGLDHVIELGRVRRGNQQHPAMRASIAQTLMHFRGAGGVWAIHLAVARLARGNPAADRGVVDAMRVDAALAQIAFAEKPGQSLEIARVAHIHRVEAAENSGNLPISSVKAAAILWRNEVKGFKYWFGADNDATIARLMQELTDNGVQTFVADLAVQLQVDRPGSQDE